ncbi:MAG TPA: thioester reductase domain-containing protein, partial [Enhygromyxa sp.]|nr:thioester reductase domain-containing protein [Enhygromyxa sp.]
LCSKNNEADAWRVFDEHPDMLLGREHIVAARINWQRKSLNLRELADELQLGLDSFIFVDDSPAECAEVEQSAPEVMVVQLPEPPDLEFFAHHWAFDAGRVTAEDRQRTQMVQQNRQRRALEQAAGSFQEFLTQLNVVIDIAPLTTDELPRAAQLTHRTNQLNATTIRRTEAELAALMHEPNTHVLRVRVTDRFGDYGFVGLMVARAGDRLICESLLLSCRVLGRRVEHQMVRGLAELARQAGLATVALQFVASSKNRPIENFYRSLRGERSASERGWQVALSVGDIEATLAEASMERDPGESRSDGESAATETSATAQRERARGLAEIASHRGDVKALLDSIRGTARVKRPTMKTEFVAPRTSWQKTIAGIWADVLGLDRVGLYDNFYELGGDSLGAAEAFARMWEVGAPESISLATIPEPTVAVVSQAIVDIKDGKQPGDRVPMLSLEDEGRLAIDIVHPGYDPSSYDRPLARVLLTGATGYLGAFLLSELMQQSDAHATCLVRAATPAEARTRVRENLARYQLWRDEYQPRIDVVLGELAEPNFGLSAGEFRSLAASIDTILHCGAWVNFVFPYQHLRPANVESVETILRLAIADLPNPIQVHFISTLGAIMSTGYPRGVPVLENDPLAHCEDLLNGYEQSKYVGDKMVWQACRERGIPASIYRPAMVSGLGDSGVYHKLDEFLPSFLKGCLQLGSWPLLDTTFEIVPVDFVCKSITGLALDRSKLNNVYHTLHPNSRTVEQYIQWFRDFGYPIRALPWEVWKRELLNQGTARLRANALFPFIDFIRPLSEPQVYFPVTDKRNFLGHVDSVGLQCPDQLELLERYTRYFIETGYFPSPR